MSTRLPAMTLPRRISSSIASAVRISRSIRAPALTSSTISLVDAEADVDLRAVRALELGRELDHRLLEAVGAVDGDFGRQRASSLGFSGP